MAVDANILIFERMKEEIKRGRELGDAVNEGFHQSMDIDSRSAIFQVNDYCSYSCICSSSTSVVKGFALVFFIGVAVSMFTAITASRTFCFGDQSTIKLDGS